MKVNLLIFTTDITQLEFQQHTFSWSCLSMSSKLIADIWSVEDIFVCIPCKEGTNFECKTAGASYPRSVATLRVSLKNGS